MKITIQRKDYEVEYELKTLILRLLLIIIIIISIFSTYKYIKNNEINEQKAKDFEKKADYNYYEELVITKNSKGSFNSLDSKVKVEGTLKLISENGKQYLQFTNNFKITNNPNLFLYLSTTPTGKAKIEIGKLIGNIGVQKYEIIGNIDFSVHKYLVIIDSVSKQPLAYAKIEL